MLTPVVVSFIGYYQYDNLMLEYEKAKILKKQQTLPANMVEVPVEYIGKNEGMKDVQK